MRTTTDYYHGYYDRFYPSYYGAAGSKGDPGRDGIPGTPGVQGPPGHIFLIPVSFNSDNTHFCLVVNFRVRFKTVFYAEILFNGFNSFKLNL